MGACTNHYARNIWSGSIFGPAGQNIWSDPPQMVLCKAHAFKSMKARVTASEIARDMCADENKDVDLVEKACLYLIDKMYPEGNTGNEKRVIRRKAAALALRDGEVSYKKGKKRIRLDIWYINKYCADSVRHHGIDIKQDNTNIWNQIRSR